MVTQAKLEAERGRKINKLMERLEQVEQNRQRQRELLNQ